MKFFLSLGKTVQVGRDNLGVQCYNYNMILVSLYSFHMYRLSKLKQNEIYSWKGNIYIREATIMGKREGRERKKKDFWWISYVSGSLSSPAVSGLLSSPAWGVWMRFLRSSKAFMLSASKPPANWKVFPPPLVYYSMYLINKRYITLDD